MTLAFFCRAVTDAPPRFPQPGDEGARMAGNRAVAAQKVDLLCRVATGHPPFASHNRRPVARNEANPPT